MGTCLFCGSYGIGLFSMVLRGGDLGGEILVWAVLTGCLGCGLRSSLGFVRGADFRLGYSRAVPLGVSSPLPISRIKIVPGAEGIPSEAERAAKKVSSWAWCEK